MFVSSGNSERKLPFLVIVIFIVVLCFVISGCSRNSKDGRGNVNVSPGVNTLEKTIKQSIQRSGGNLDGQNIHLVIGIFTGSFDQDPQGAIATREMACQLAFKVLRPGDRLSIKAWEMDLWQPGSRSNLTRVFTKADKTRPVNIYGMLPLTQKSGSRGGHDTERAITSILRQYDREKNAVVVLLANNASSMAGHDGSRPVGQSNRAYRRALSGWRRERSVNSTNASAQLPFKYAGSAWRQMDAVVLVPDRFYGPQLSPERAKQPAYSDPRVQGDMAGFWKALGWLVIASLVIGLLWWLWSIITPPPPPVPCQIMAHFKDNPNTVALEPSVKWNTDEPAPLFRLYGGSRPQDEPMPHLFLRDNLLPFPAVVLFDITYDRNMLHIKPNPAFPSTQLSAGTDVISKTLLSPFKITLPKGLTQTGLVMKLPGQDVKLPITVSFQVKSGHRFAGMPFAATVSQVVCLEIAKYIPPEDADDETNVNK